MGVVLAPKHMSLANESKPDSRPGRHCVDLLRCLQNSACYSPMRIFPVVRLSYHTNSGFVQYNRDFCKKPAGEHRRKRVLPRRVSLCVEMRFIPRRRCQPRALRRPMPHRLGSSLPPDKVAASISASCSAVGSSSVSASMLSVCASSSWSVRASTITLSFSPRRMTRTPEP